MSNLVNKVDPFKDGSGIALYQLDGNANDLGGNYNGTWHGTEQYDVGKFGQAAKFNGHSYITMGNWLTNVSNTEQLTFSYWVKDTDTSDQTLWSTDQLESANSVLITVNNFQYWDNQAIKILFQIDLTDGSWHNIICVIDTINNNVAYYKDNILVGSSNISSGSSILNSSDMSLGKRSSLTYYTKGLIDQVRIFNRALTAKEISYLYKEIKPISFTRSNTF